METFLHGITPSRAPIESWVELLSPQGVAADLERLRAIYREHFPTQGELIFTGACGFTCQHCIYPSNYASSTSSLSPEKWKDILWDLNKELGIHTFVYGGRAVTRHGIEVLASLRAMSATVRIGLIDNGISMLPYRDLLSGLRLDWIDISLDGLAREHDIQRGKKGSFAAALEMASWLKDHSVAPKINILTCLTTINRDSVVEMIQVVNRLGFKNVFITPVAILDGYRPSPDLRVSGQAFMTLIEEIEDTLAGLDDAWIELLLFGVEYVEYIAEYRPQLWDLFEPEGEHLTWKTSKSGNDFSINYYPLSLTGIREFIVNSNGTIIPPTVMAKGLIPTEEQLGNLLHEGPLDIVMRLPESRQFRFYYEQLCKEQRSIRSPKMCHSNPESIQSQSAAMCHPANPYKTFVTGPGTGLKYAERS